MDTDMTVEKPKLFIFDSLRRDVIKRVRQFIAHDGIILNKGSHEAPYTQCLSSTMMGIDAQRSARFGFSRDLLKELEGRTNFIPIIGSAEDLPFKAGFFNRIVCTEILEHVRSDKNEVSKMAKFLVNEGRAFLTAPNGDVIPLEYGIREHVHHYPEKDLHNLLNNSFEQVVRAKE